jgi:hypothetical protein
MTSAQMLITRFIISERSTAGWTRQNERIRDPL